MRTFLLALALSCTALPVCACHPRADPMYGVAGPDDLKHFERIFVGEVVAVRLTEHIDQLRASKGSELETLEIMGGSWPFDLEVYPSEVMKGPAASPQSLKAGGCLVAVPALYDRVIVFQTADGWARFRVLQGAKAREAATGAENYVADVRECVAGACSRDKPP